MFKQQMVSERNMFVFRSRPLNFSVFLCHRHDRVAETDVSRIRLHTPGFADISWGRPYSRCMFNVLTGMVDRTCHINSGNQPRDDAMRSCDGSRHTPPGI